MSDTKPSDGDARDDGAGGGSGTAAAATPTPAPSADPMDAAAYRIATTADGPAVTAVVPLADAIRIRDEAVAEVLGEAERALAAMRAGHAAQIDQAFAKGAAHAIAQLPVTVADLLDEIADAVELDDETEEVQP